MNGKLIVAVLALVSALFAAWAYMVSDDQRYETLEKAADTILDRLFDT